MTVTPSIMATREPRSRLLYAVIAASVAALIGLNVYLTHTGQATLQRLMPLLRLSDDVHYELAHFHKWFEAYARERRRFSETQTWVHFEHGTEAVRILRTRLSDADLGIANLRDIETVERIQNEIATMEQALSALRVSARDRMALPPDSPHIAEFDARFDAQLTAAELSATTLKRHLEGLVSAQVRNMRDTTLMLYALFAAAALTALWLLRRQDRLRRAQSLNVQKLGLAVEQSPASVMITDTHGIIEYVNPKFEQVSGYSAADVLGKNPRILKSGHTTQGQYTQLWTTITSGEVWRGEFHNKRKDGSLYWEVASISPIRDEDGVICNFVAVKEDITRQKLQAKRLEQSRELFTRAFHSNPALIALSHPVTGEHVDVNEAWCKTLKFSRDEAIGRTAFDMDLWAHPGDRKRILAELAEHGRLRNFQAELKARDGTLIDCLISTEPIHLDDQELVMWSANDITARRKSEREVEYQRTLFEAIFNGIPDAIVYADRNRAIVAVNPGFEKIFDYTRQDLINQQTRELYASEDEYERQGRLRFHADAQISHEPYVVNYKRADGTIFPGETLGTAIADKDGNPLGFIAVIRDITERKQIEDQLIHAKEDAEYANYAKSQFLANMSHELRTPLNAILGFAEMIRMEAFGPLGSDKYAEYVDDIHESGHHLLNIITDILDVSKIEAGRLELSFEDVSLAGHVEACMTILQTQAADRGITVEVAMADGLPLLKADPVRLKQIILNLVNNAIKFNRPGGRVDVEGLLNGEGGVVLIVSDTGIGIDEADLKRILEPFGQASDITTRPHGGSGLGLSLSKALMELHGGRINVDSAPGEGTQVTCIFPPERTVRPAPPEGART